MRIVSLLPAATELVCLAGAGAFLVGRSHECDHPPGVEELPSLTRPRTEMPRASADIDAVVREALIDALSIYLVDAEPLIALRPDVVVTQDLCEVCAVSADDVAAAIAPLGAAAPRLVRLAPTRLEHVWDDLVRIGRAVGHAEAAEEAARALRSRTDRLRRRMSGLPRRTILTVEWTEPVMIGGTWMPDLVEIAGGRALLAEPGAPGQVATREQLVALDPDVVLVKPCGFSLERVLEDLPVLRRTLPWERWRAIREGRVFLADGNALFNRSGPRLVESAEVLAGAMHPEVVPELRSAHAAFVRRLTSDGTVVPFDA